MKLMYVLLALFLPLIAIGQNKEGVIIYDETVKMDLDIPEEHREQLASILPESRTAKKILLFNADESIYKDHEEQEKDEVVEAGSEDGGMRIKMVMTRPDNQLYKNMAKQEVVQKEELMGRYFRIVDKLETFPWKLHNEAKDILGYTCQKATMTHDEQEVIAWYSLQIPTGNGPMSYGQLPGMILELDIDGGQVHVIASEVNFKSLEKGAITVPEKGKKVSREDFDTIQAQKQKEMEEEYGESGGRMIIRHRED